MNRVSLKKRKPTKKRKTPNQKDIRFKHIGLILKLLFEQFLVKKEEILYREEDSQPCVCYKLSMSIMLTIFDVSIKEKRAMVVYVLSYFLSK